MLPALTFSSFTYLWVIVGHQFICQVAQDRLSESAAAAVKELLPAYAENDLSTLCSWADRIKFRYRWSSELHYIDTPDDLCTYNYNRDCKDEGGVRGRCVSGAITNYTNQLLTYGSSADEPQYNLTEALLFLSHLMGDIHQSDWSDQVVKWEKCSNNDVTCPDIYASESIKAACNWAYKDVKNNTVLEDDYFLSRLPIVNLRLAESAVRLAATLNRIFK
ncbi:hypothetical protein ZIOFF_062615 [Zingiber officinale]|uniref:Aspergillus nuclease S1 n=1 Tax=Zingiber officinale TaxID=94328 RepID=A0A8J5F5B3_ZINOF|nr:hypothetical protein ZIOFF_062615 [Zingiber officinale]